MARSNPRLVDAESPYLAEAAEQPVDWYTWGEEAFEAAREQGKPLLVDSGAVWCHWCHVMDHESYEDPETAEIINERFVPVKLDRDERPHVDRRLQEAVGAITGRGGWPLTAFLTPDGDVYYGGTYFPPEPQGGMPSFQQVLGKAAAFYEDQPDKAVEQAERIREAIEGAVEPAPGETGAEPVLAAVDQATSAYDPVHGGFGSQPKFPHASTLDLLLTYAQHHDDERAQQAREAALDTLDAMAAGGLYDHVGGGFHRYSVDARFHVPHFEKMLYDNAALAGVYARAAAICRHHDQADRADRLEATARDTARFMIEVLGRPGGGFGGSQDADRRPEAEGPLARTELDDGDYFTWSLEEAREVLDADELKLARQHLGLEQRGDMDHDPARNVLQIEATVEDIAAATDRDVETVQALADQVLDKLAQARSQREAPIVDPTVYADWNGMAIEALLRLDGYHDVPEARQAALEALDRLLEEAYDEERGFAHALGDAGARIHGLVADQVHMLPALIEAHTATQEPTYLDAARRVGEIIVERFQREDGLLRASLDDERPATPGDQPTPAPAALTALELPRLARLTGEDRFTEAADRILGAIAGRSQDLGGLHGGTLHLAMHARVHEPPHTVVTGGDEPARQLIDAARRSPVLGATVLHARNPDQPGVPQEAREAAKRFEGEAAAIVCRGRSCQLAEDPEALTALLNFE